ncbi:MAG: recombinase family protein [Pseudomonadota bacterium]
MNFWPDIESGGRRIGYARVSTKDQKLRMQLDALKAVNCDEIFTDHGISGAKAKRPGLDEALAALEPGDMFVVLRLCRLGRSVLHLADLLTRFRNEGINFCSIAEGINTTTPGGKLVYHIFAGIAEFQRDIIRENTMHGIEAARARGRQIGRPFKLNEYQVMGAHEMIHQRGASLRDVAIRYDVTPSTVARAFGRFGLESS